MRQPPSALATSWSNHVPTAVAGTPAIRATAVRSGAASSTLFFQNERLRSATTETGSVAPARGTRTSAPSGPPPHPAPAGSTTKLGPAARRVRAESSPDSRARAARATAAATPTVTASMPNPSRTRRAASDASSTRVNTG